MEIAGYKGGRIHRTTLSLCPHCGVMTYTMMDDDGNRYCGKCKDSKVEKTNESMDELVKEVWQWFDEKGLDDPVMQMVKVTEEVGELASEIARHHYDSSEVVDALGDSFVTLIGMCHHLNVSPATALSTAYNEIKNRKGKVINGSFVKEN